MQDVFKELVWDGFVRASIASLFAAVPFLTWGPLGFLITTVVMLFTDRLYAAVKMTVDLEVIVFKNKQFESAFDNAAIKLKVVAVDYGGDSSQYKAARIEHQKALSQFVRFGVAR